MPGYIPSTNMPNQNYDPSAPRTGLQYSNQAPPAWMLPTMQQTPIGGSANAYALGQAAANQQAYQPDMTNMNQSRGMQLGALALSQQAAMGQGPSQAQALMQSQTDAGLQAQLAGAASARGGAMQQAAAYRNASQQAASTQAASAQQLGAMRANEMATAQGQYDSQANALQSSDAGNAALQSQNANTQRALNQQGQLGFNQQAIGIDSQNAANTLQQYGIDSQNWQTDQNNAVARAQQESQISQHSVDRQTGVYGALAGGVSAVGSTLATISDESAKMNIMPLTPQPSGMQLQAPGAGGGMQLQGQGGFYLSGLGTSPTSFASPTATTSASNKPSLGAIAATAGKSGAQTFTQGMRSIDPMTIEIVQPNRLISDQNAKVVAGIAQPEYSLSPGRQAHLAARRRLRGDALRCLPRGDRARVCRHQGRGEGRGEDDEKKVTARIH